MLQCVGCCFTLGFHISGTDYFFPCFLSRSDGNFLHEEVHDYQVKVYTDFI